MTPESKCKLSDVLFELDYANTSCKENDCFDEYDFVVQATESFYESGLSFRQSIRKAFDEIFGIELTVDQIDCIIARLNDIAF